MMLSDMEQNTAEEGLRAVGEEDLFGRMTYDQKPERDEERPFHTERTASAKVLRLESPGPFLELGGSQ